MHFLCILLKQIAISNESVAPLARFASKQIGKQRSEVSAVWKFAHFLRSLARALASLQN